MSDSAALAMRAAEYVADVMRASVRSRSGSSVALSGGSTPQPAYRRLTESPFGDGMPWARTLVYFGDERVVPPESEKSNYRQACDNLLDRVAVPQNNVCRIRGELAARDAASEYEHHLVKLAHDSGQQIPRFDLMLMGVGPCGHTASLFPGTQALAVDDHLAIPVEVPRDLPAFEDAKERVTMTYPVINNARHILFLVGPDKAEILGRIEAGDETLPAARVRPVNGEMVWFVARS